MNFNKDWLNEALRQYFIAEADGWVPNLNIYLKEGICKSDTSDVSCADCPLGNYCNEFANTNDTSYSDNLKLYLLPLYQEIGDLQTYIDKYPEVFI